MVRFDIPPVRESAILKSCLFDFVETNVRRQTRRGSRKLETPLRSSPNHYGHFPASRQLKCTQPAARPREIAAQRAMSTLATHATEAAHIGDVIAAGGVEVLHGGASGPFTMT